MSRVVVAMSGGVDSSVAAALLVEAGHEVEGVMLRLWAEESAAENLCCDSEAVRYAGEVAGMLGIPFATLDYGELFREQVVDYFAGEYGAGRTPNPCLVCNRRLRFGRFLEDVLARGDVGHLATGHYARVRKDAGGAYHLLRGVDSSRDQSYVLYALSQGQLSHVMFPLGALTKEEVRGIARERGLPVAEREESQDVCFAAGDYREFLRRYAPDTVRPGPILDTSGRELGRHGGLPFYTVGQRRGLGIPTPRPDSPPLFVLEIDGAANAVVVGREEELGKRALLADEVVYVSGAAPAEPVRVTAKIRYRAREAAALLTPLDAGRAHLLFDRPLRDITPGQGVVFYDGEEVVGGGIIERGMAV